MTVPATPRAVNQDNGSAIRVVSVEERVSAHDTELEVLRVEVRRLRSMVEALARGQFSTE